LISQSIKEIKFKKIYCKTHNKIHKYDNIEKLPFETNVEYFHPNKINKKFFIYQTNDLSDALEYMEIYDKAKKYNL